MFTKRFVVVLLFVLAFTALLNSPKATSMPAPTPQENQFTVVQAILPKTNGEPMNVSMRVDSRTGRAWVLGLKNTTMNPGEQPRPAYMWLAVPEEK